MAKREAKLQKAKANAPTKSGEPLVVQRGRRKEVFKTERTAISYWNNREWYKRKGYKNEEEETICATIVRSIAEKRGITEEELLAELNKKFDIKWKKEGNC